jgi:hypothetical protein
MRHRLGSRQRLRIDTLKIEIDLGVWVSRRQFLRELQGEGGLPDTFRTSKAEDGKGTSFGESGAESLQILGPADKVARRRGELVECGDGRSGRVDVDVLVAPDGIDGRGYAPPCLNSLQVRRSPRN